MRRNTKWIFFPATFLLINLASCKPRKAIEFRETIVQKERVAFNILVGKNSTEMQKLDCLIKGDYKGGLAAIDKQEEEFNKIIKDIGALPDDGIKQGHALKKAALNYYVALKELQLFEREEIMLREASLRYKNEELRAAQNKSLELSLQKQRMYAKVNEKDEALYGALQKFNTANGISN